MKKLKIALSLIFALTFSLFLVACGGGGEVMDIVINTENAKTEFKEGEAFDATGLVVNVYYRGKDDPVTLEEGKYNIDSSKFDSSKPGTYEIVVDPEQTPAENAQRVTKSYTVTVVHNWVQNGDGTASCACGARQEVKELTDTVTTVGWGNPATLEATPSGTPAKAPVAGENHVNYGVLVPGQTVNLTLKIVAVDTGAVYNTPLMGVRSGVNGLIPREDSYVIGTCAGFSTPEGGTKDAAPQSGTATKDSTPWLVYKSGDAIYAADLTGGTVVVSYEYSSDSVMTIRHTLTKADGSTKTQANSFAVPRGSYEIVAYGEKVTYQVTKYESIMNNFVTKFTATLPTAVYQPEGKLFDTTGIKAVATMSDGSTIEDSFNAYATLDVVNKDGTTTPTRMNLASTPLSAEMYDFYVEFAQNTVYFTEGGAAGGKSQITVIPSEFSVANASAVVKNGVVFDAPLFTADYAVNATNDAVEIAAGGTAAVLTAAQKEELGTTAKYFVAAKLSGFAEGAVDGAAVDNGGYAHYADGVVELILPMGQDYTLTLTKEGATVQTTKINLEKVVVPEVGVYVASTDFTLDAGGTYNVVFTGAAGTDDEQLVVGGMRSTIGEIKAAINENPEEGWAALSGQLWVTSVEKTDEGVVVGVKVAAPDLINLSATNASSAVEYRDADNNTLASAALNYEMRFSETIPEDVKDIVKISGDTVVFVQRDKLYVIRAVSADSVAGKLEYTDLFIDATLNIQNAAAASYDVSVSSSAGGVKADENNAITLSGDASGKLVALGNVGSATDYDYGALVVYSFSVSALGFREDDVKETYYFTANEDPKGQDSYTVYKVDGNVITADVVEAANAGERVDTQTWSCVNDGIKAFKYGDTEFYFGGIVTPATGEHVWEASETENLEVCANCGYTRERVETENGYYYITLSTPTAYEDMPNATWWNEVNGVNDVSGNFAVEYTYTHADGTGDYTNARLQLVSGADTSTIDLAATADVVVVQGMLSSGDSAVISTQELLKDGVAVDKSAWMAHGTGKGEFNGDVTALITRSGTVLEIRTEWTAPSGSTYVNHIVVDNFTQAPVTIQIGGFLPAVVGLNAKIGNIATTSTVDLKLGAEDNTTGYTGETPLWTGTISVGQKVTMSGTATSSGAAVWNGPMPYLWTGETAALNFRPDNYINGAAADQASVPAMGLTIAKVWKGFTPESANGADWLTALTDHYKQGEFECTFVWDWTDASMISIQIAFVWEDATYNQEYQITSSGAGLLDTYSIGLGVDGSYFHVTSMITE